MSAILYRKLKRAHAYLREGDAGRARALCEEALGDAPHNPDALYLLGLAQLAEGRARDAVAPLNRVLAADPRHASALEHLGLARLMLGEFAEAETVLSRAAALPRAPATTFMRLGVAILEQGRPAEALPALQRAHALEPRDVDCHLNLGRALARTGDVAGAREFFLNALRVAPNHIDAAFNMGALALQQDDLAEAQRWFERVLHESPRYVDAMINLGIVLQKQARLDDAADCLRGALALDRSSAAAGSELARTFALQGRLEEAREGFRAVLRTSPHFTAAHEDLAYVCIALNRVGEGIEHLRLTLQAEPGNSGAASALAGALFEAGQLDEAEALAQRAIEASPGSAAAYATLANLRLVGGKLDAAIATLENGYARTRESVLLGMLAYQLRQACDWSKWQAAWTELAPELARGSALGSPFWLLCEPITAAQQLAYTRRWAQARFKAVNPGTHRVDAHQRHPRLRIGYLSSDFQEHAVGHLIVEALELHDRDRFEVFAYSHGPDKESAMRQRLRSACEHFVDIGREPDDAAAARIRMDELDLLVDLKGYTVGDRLAVMARRPCRVQLAWLGYPGTTGAPFIDYLIADPFLIPSGEEAAYSERILRLPHCYQPSDRKRDIAAPLARRDYGIPEGAFVFCCFNQAYKITPDVYAAWMRLLSRVPESVLWLLDCNHLARRNLLDSAREHGVAPQRLVFGPLLPNAAHLARYRAADLALDTFPYTSHTTLSDALWCGCPAVGLTGETFAARVSGSILTAAGLPDLVSYTIGAYEELAGRLAVEPRFLEETRARVARARDSSPLFDTAGFIRDLERIYLGCTLSS